MFGNMFTPSENSLLCMRGMFDGKRRSFHWFPWLMLVWTTWIFITPVYDTNGTFPNWKLPTFASFAVFLWLFYRVYYRDRNQVLWCALAVAALGFTVTPLNPGAQGYIIYACAFLGVCSGTRTRDTVRNMLLMLGLYVLQWLWLEYPWIYLFNAVIVGLAIGLMNINFMRKYEREIELKLSHDEVRRLAATAERERIGRDLHDLLGHTLSLITLKSELANKLFDRDVAAAKREMADVERVARDALAQVRRAVTGIRAAGFAAELASAKLLLECNHVRLDYTLADTALPPELETALAMTVREAATNIQRHARAMQARIALERDHDAVILRIEDDGRGGAIVPGNGLSGMRERLSAVGAQLRIESQRGKGTTLTVTAALAQAAAEPSSASRVVSPAVQVAP
ncbi:MAG: sensor histidine kinase [Gammaproteobacteria bacterium]|nr:MAG: sensor histidine kinase [Gammaproteobacteria bacterium]